MAFLLSHMSAANFWRTVYFPDRAPRDSVALAQDELGEGSMRRLREIAPPWLNAGFAHPEKGVVHLLVRNLQRRQGRSSAVTHVWSQPIPEGSFYRYSDDLFVASPEFVFMQMATKLDFTQLVAYGIELCGNYSFDPHEEYGFRPRGVPLTTPGKLYSYLEGARSLPGADQALRALQYVGAHSESPMETVQWELLRLPFRMGGYGIERLEMNAPISVSGMAVAMAQKDKCRADLHIIGSNLIIEYLGKRDHLGEMAFDADRRRTNALTDMGFQVVEVTSGQIRDWRAFESIALRAASASGKKVKKQHRGALPARVNLRRTLFAWNSCYGRPQ